MACLAADAAADSQSRGADWLMAACERSAGAPLLERMLHLEMHGFLPDHNLNYTDKASMAHGVEVRVPFIAPRLVELANRIPWTLKTRGLAEKWIFKQAQTGILPDKILNRKKTGFGGPVRAWVTHGRLGGFAREIINSTSFRQRGLFDHRACERALADTIAGRRDCAYLIHAVVMIELWMRKFVDDRGRFMQVSNAVPQITSV